MSDIGKPQTQELLSGIEKDAREEAEALLASARQYVAEREAACAGKLAEIRKEAADKLAKQAEEIRRSIRSAEGVEKRRLALKVREQIIADVIGKVKENLAARVSDKAYQETLVAWIVEAAIGLNTSEATVNACQAEKALLDRELLIRIEKRITELTGKSIKLQPADAPPLSAQGVVLTALDKRTAFNNQVQTRLLRYQGEIRKIIYDTLFKD